MEKTYIEEKTHIDQLRDLYHRSWTPALRRQVAAAAAAIGHPAAISEIWQQVANFDGPAAAVASDAARIAAAAPPEHKAIMTVDPHGHYDPSVFALCAHLGTGARPAIWKDRRTGARIMTGGEGLTALERIIFEDAVCTGQGEPCLAHYDRSRRAWHAAPGLVRAEFPELSPETATALHADLNVIGMTAEIAAMYRRRLHADFDATFAEIRHLADGLREATGTAADPAEIAEALDDGEIDPDDLDEPEPEEASVPAGIKYHKLDDYRDCPSLQARFRAIGDRFLAALATIEDAPTLDVLKTIGKKRFVDAGKLPTAFYSALWKAYHARKRALTPPLTPIAAKAITALRSLDPKSPEGKKRLAKAAAWLNGPGGKLPKSDLSQICDVWHEKKGRRKDTASAFGPEPPFNPSDLSDLCHGAYDYQL